jgi:IstB-like ATP binding protein
MHVGRSNVQLRRGAMCIFSAFMSFLGMLDSAFNILCGDRLPTFKLGSPAYEFFSSRRPAIAGSRQHVMNARPISARSRREVLTPGRGPNHPEAAGQDATNLRTRRERAGFPAGKTFGDWDEAASSIPRPTQDALKTLEWIRNKETLCIRGPSGTGKSHFCEALGQAAVEEGLTVAWFTIEDLGALMRRHRVDDSIARAITRVIPY